MANSSDICMVFKFLPSEQQPLAGGKILAGLDLKEICPLPDGYLLI